MRHLTVHHATRYSYARPVALGEHRLMIRPRDSHDLRLAEATLVLSPPGEIRWIHDVFGNSIAIVTFAQPVTELVIESTLSLDRYPYVPPRLDIDPDAATYPFIYSPEDRRDLGPLREPHYADAKDVLAGWISAFVMGKGTDTLALLADINNGIKTGFTYQAREAEGTQTPVETIEKGSGTCRDFALLFIEAARHLGFGARFVSGYLYDPALDVGAEGEDIQGAGATHAWAEVYLPGAGWVEYDPTNGLIGSEALIRIAVTRDAGQATPIGGSFTGEAGDYLGMTVDVSVTARG
ncbi:transglutaminase family protein [Zavarzinia compransoris]|uniref:Transglutaminase n=1 Tax=Zavarzinia compransoris TaxID=1264899 RepID=A0A317E830_9PROT|nr:transglutaminase family protein [Zavarzinia compransoris]PWR23298.1 transglutaminase [Zavarzinia compransoris]TDP46131.1 transglutaminase-like putative cysteine protease [Zavarzinia compransoris]